MKAGSKIDCISVRNVKKGMMIENNTVCVDNRAPVTPGQSDVSLCRV
jgi:hypothetical protein